MTDSIDECTFIPHGPEGLDVGVGTERPRSPAIPQETRLLDQPKDGLPVAMSGIKQGKGEGCCGHGEIMEGG